MFINYENNACKLQGVVNTIIGKHNNMMNVTDHILVDAIKI